MMRTANAKQRVLGLGIGAGCLVLATACGSVTEADGLSYVGESGEGIRGDSGGQEAEFEVSGETPSAPTLRVEWTSPLRGWQRANRMVLRAAVTNDGREPYRVRVQLTGPEWRGIGTSPVRGDETIAPGETREFEFSVEEMSVRSSRVPGEVLVRAEYTDPHRDVRRVTSTSRYVRFSENFRRAKVTSKPRGLKVRKRASRTWAGLWKQASRATQGEFTVNELTAEGEQQSSPASFVVPFNGPQQSPWNLDLPFKSVERGERYRLCAKWRAEYIDAAGGEDYLNKPFLANYPARFARARVTVAPQGEGGQQLGWAPANIWKGYLDENGCTPLLKLTSGSPYALYTQGILKKPDDTEVEIRFNEDSTEGYLTFFTAIPSILPITTVNLPTGHSYITQVAAIISQAMVTPDMGLSGEYVEVYANQGCGGTVSACYGGRLYIGKRPNGIHNSSYKYVVGHEFGHAVQHKSGAGIDGEGYDSGYDDEGQGKACTCEHVFSANQLHCLQSREGLGDAIKEGWGQFYASKIFNRPEDDDCQFAYYKEFNDNNLIKVVPNWHSCVEPVTWMENACVRRRRGTEFDWMQFLYFVNTQSDFPLTIADLGGIFSGIPTKPLFNEPDATGIYWQDIDQSAEDYLGAGSDEYLAWESAVIAYGVGY